MDIFPKGELRTLLETQTVGCISVSIYMPTYKGSKEAQQNPIRLKNLLRDAHGRLEKAGLRSPEATKFLEPAEKLLDDSFFWRQQSDGLVVLLSKDFFRYYRLPVAFKETIVVNNRFHVKPLLPMLSADGLFYVLAVSQKAVRFLQCTHYGFKEIDLTGIAPRSLAEALKYEHVDREQPYHHHYRASGGDSQIARGAEMEDAKDDLLRYFYQIDRGLCRDILENENAPLVIVGVDYLFPIYKQANSYPGLLDKSIEGNPDKLSSEELHRKAWAVVESHFNREQETAIRKYRKFAGTGKATEDLKEIVPHSYTGRVHNLLVASGAQQWGTFDPSTNTVELHAKEESCDGDLLDFAAAYTLSHRGTVYVIEPEKLPDGSPAAAVLRY